MRQEILEKHGITNRYLVLILASVVLAYFSPCILYMVSSAGISLVDEEKVLGVTINVDDPWYPLASSQSFLGIPFGLNRLHRSTVLYVKNRWILPWPTDFLFVSSDPNMQYSSPDPSHFSRVLVAKNEGYAAQVIGSKSFVVVVPKFKLTFESKLRDAIDSIAHINPGESSMH